MFVVKDANGIVTRTIIADRSNLTATTIVFESVVRLNGLTTSTFVTEVPIEKGMSVVPV